MRKFIKITILPDDTAGISAPMIMNNAMEKLHQLFVHIKDEKDNIPVGISFPEYDDENISLGKIIHVIGEETDLAALKIREQVKSLQDYLHVSDIRAIPAQKVDGYVAYARVRHDSSKEKLVRRSMKRHNLSKEEAEQNYKKYDRQTFPRYPFVLLRSKSTGAKNYPLYLKRIFLQASGPMSFNTFGINPKAGVENF